jgi:hypothetical protein
LIKITEKYESWKNKLSD